MCLSPVRLFGLAGHRLWSDARPWSCKSCTSCRPQHDAFSGACMSPSVLLLLLAPAVCASEPGSCQLPVCRVGPLNLCYVLWYAPDCASEPCFFATCEHCNLSCSVPALNQTLYRRFQGTANQAKARAYCLTGCCPEHRSFRACRKRIAYALHARCTALGGFVDSPPYAVRNLRASPTRLRLPSLASAVR